MRKIKWNNLIKILLFILLASGMGSIVLHVFNYKSTGGGGGWMRFYQEKENNIDVLFFGSSHTHCTVDYGYLWENYGMAGFSLTAGSQMIDSTSYFVEEALKTQKPRVIVVEVVGATGTTLADSDAVVYRNTLGMKWSYNLWNFVKYLSGNLERDATWEKEVFAKYPIIHSRYAELTKEDFVDSIPFMRGYRGSFESVHIDTPQFQGMQDTMELMPEKLAYLEKIVALAEENGVPVMFFASPYSLDEDRQKQFNWIAQFAEERDIPFVNFNHLYDEIGLNFDTDMRDTDHVNNTGAVKVTEYLAQFLKSHYEIPDRRGQAGYKAWEQNAIYLHNKTIRYELENAVDINDYLQKLSELENGQTVILALTGNYNALGEVYLEKLMQLGITAEEYYAGGVWIFKDGKISGRLPGNQYQKFIYTESGELYLGSAVQVDEYGELHDRVKIVINGTDYKLIENGVNIVVYNEEIDQVIDAAGDDIYLGLELIHNEKPEE